jgi:hypothetical protein
LSRQCSSAKGHGNRDEHGFHFRKSDSCDALNHLSVTAERFAKALQKKEKASWFFGLGKMLRFSQEIEDDSRPSPIFYLSRRDGVERILMKPFDQDTLTATTDALIA